MRRGGHLRSPGGGEARLPRPPCSPAPRAGVGRHCDLRWVEFEAAQSHGTGRRHLYRRCVGEDAGHAGDWAHQVFDRRRFGATERSADSCAVE